MAPDDRPRYASRRRFAGAFAKLVATAATMPAWRLARGDGALHRLSDGERRRMYTAALTLVFKNIRGGTGEPYFKKPFLDAAFSSSIYLWDTCFMTAYAKYHQAELPIAQALDNFYELQDSDGYICREYTRDGTPFWPKDHPVSSNPPLLAFAELELHSISRDLARLRRVYPLLRSHYRYMIARYSQPNGLFFNDAFGSGMDNIPRYPKDWSDDGQGIALRNLHPELFVYDGLSPKWNRQGSMVDISAQMALFAEQLTSIARHIGAKSDIRGYDNLRGQIYAAINRHCWREDDGWYYDLGYGQHVRRRHIGMFWMLWAGLVPAERLGRVLSRLTDPRQFWRHVPIASTPGDDPGFSPRGNYWLGSVWAPTNYMIIRGLRRVGRHDLATRLAQEYYAAVADVFARTGTFWENYAPDAYAPGNQARPDFCGWTALAPIALYHEFFAANSR